jgi:hypothetical protein
MWRVTLGESKRTFRFNTLASYFRLPGFRSFAGGERRLGPNQPLADEVVAMRKPLPALACEHGREPVGFRSSDRFRRDRTACICVDLARTGLAGRRPRRA